MNPMTRRNVVMAFAATAVTALVPTAFAQHRDNGEYRILQARYGTSRRNIDVTDRLRELARSDRSFRLTNELFGTDPDQGHVKTLRIYARTPRGASKTFEYREGGVIDGSQFVGWDRGDWGHDGRRGGWGR
jgi:hypothetical protein